MDNNFYYRNNKCPPIIYNFDPKNGLSSDKTFVNISINPLNVKYISGQMYKYVINNITIAGTNCLILEKSSDKVSCVTDVANEEKEGKLF